jgi:hypothetical protein
MIASAFEVDLAPQLLDLQLQRGDDRLGVRGLRNRPHRSGFGFVRPGFGHHEGGTQGFDIGRYGAVHGVE